MPKQVVVIGAGIGGLAAAIHLRIRGYGVELHEQQPQPGGRAGQLRLGGYSFDTGPSLLNYPWVFEELFAAAGRDFHSALPLTPIDPSVSFAWPDGTRLHLSSSLDLLGEELARLEPDCRPALHAWLRDAERKYRLSFDRLVSRNEDNPLRWLGRCGLTGVMNLSLNRNLYGEIGRFFRSRYIREALASYGMYLGGSPFELPGLFSILPYGEIAYGLWLPRGGMHGLSRAMASLALELGAELHFNSPVATIQLSGTRVSGVRLHDDRNVDADAVLSNCDLPTTASRMLQDSASTRTLKQRTSRLRMTPGVITFYWGVKGIPAGLEHHSIFLPEDYRHSFGQLSKKQQIPDDLPFYVAVPSRSDSTLAPHGSHSVFVLVPTPVLSSMPNADWSAIVANTRAKVLSRLRREGLELDPHQIETEEVWTPRQWQANYGLHDGSAFGAAHGLFEVGPFRMPNYSQSVKGLFFVGASTTPGTGVPLVTIGGRLAAERIAAHVL